jgi:hypothetical protein
LTEFFSEDGSVDDFAMPGDEALAAQLGIGDQPETEAAPEKPRDDQGRFAKTEPEQPEPEPEADATPEPEAAEPETTPEPGLILGKFKNADELAAAYQELESFKGRQSSEISDLRRALEERFATLEQQAARPAAPSSWEDLIDDNPAAATKLAYEHGDTVAMQRAARAWEDVAPGAPELWAETVRLRSEMNTRLAAYDEALGPVRAQADASVLQDGVRRLTGAYPEIGEFLASDEFARLADQIPLAKKALTEGAPDEVVSAIETVYLIHRGRASDNLKDTAREVARTAAEEAQTMREEAFVASATATTAAPRASKADEYAAGWDDTDALFDNGWNV